jgi:hypothetical protein
MVTGTKVLNKGEFLESSRMMWEARGKPGYTAT